MAITIRTNNVPRNPIYGYELSEKERKEFDYIDAEHFDGHSFLRYKGELYDLSDFMRAREISELSAWDGYASDSYFSGIVIKYVDNFERVIVGTYIS
jgi:hypothetical protein